MVFILGSNIDLENVLILGVETDAVWADRGETKTVSKILVIDDFNDKFKDAGVTLDEDEKFQKGDTAVYCIGFKENGLVQHGFVLVFPSLTVLCLMWLMVLLMRKYRVLVKFQEQKNWQMGKPSKEVSTTVFDKIKTMEGFTLGGGIDFAMTDHVLLRAEYRYSDFGKKEYKKDYLKLGYTTNDFRVSIAYKF
ncbi:outer membrane protein [Bartonella sp. AP57NXGY]|uniref:outer membrane protein n=1 Tax=Bartonella sp. AP57NXGY TaxID=3243497 RepID=UPI0035CF6BCF